MTRKLPLGLLFSSSAGIETADKAIYGAKNRLRHDLIGYLKRMPDGSNLYFEEIRTGRRTTPGRQCRGPGAHRRGHARGPGLDITPALRENAMRGLPLFSRRSDEHARGLRSAKEALLNKSEVADAVTHSILGPTTIGYGAPGSAKKDYKVGDWRSHIIVRRTLEGEDPGETLVRVIDVPRMVNQDVDMGPRDGERVDVELNGYTAVVSLYRFGNKEAWLLTGFKGLPKGYPSTHWATHPKCLVSHSEWLQILLAG